MFELEQTCSLIPLFNIHFVSRTDKNAHKKNKKEK